MRIIVIKPNQAPLLRRGLDHLIRGLMLDRANRAAMEDRDAATEAVNQAVELKRIVGDMPEDASGVLVVGGGPFSFPGLRQIDDACEALFGIGGTPDVLVDAIQAHHAMLAIALSAAAHVGGLAEAMMDAVRAVLEEAGPAATLSGDAVSKRVIEDLRETLDQVEACAEPKALDQDGMDRAFDRVKTFAPGITSWASTILNLRDKRMRQGGIDSVRRAGDDVANLLEEAIPQHIYDFDNGDEQPKDCPYRKAIEDWRATIDPDFEEVR